MGGEVDDPAVALVVDEHVPLDTHQGRVAVLEAAVGALVGDQQEDVALGRQAAHLAGEGF